MENEKIINLDADSKEVCLKALKDINDQLGFFYDLVKTGQLTEDTRDTLSGLFEYRMADLSKHTGYDSKSAKKVEEKHAEIRKLNIRIRDLEEKLGSEDLTEKLSAQIKYLSQLLNKWWDIDGFNYIREFHFRKYGLLEVEFGFSFNEFRSSYSDKPVSVKEKHKNWIEQVEERGYKLIKNKREVDLMDCDENRKLISELIKSRFPSADIIEWRNYNIGRNSNEDQFEIRSVTVIIRELREIKALEQYVNKFHEVDED